jgi:hypothetical protein
MSPRMFKHLKRSESFSGLLRGIANQWKLLAAFQEAEPYLGLPPHASKLLTWLVKQRAFGNHVHAPPIERGRCWTRSPARHNCSSAPARRPSGT